MGLEIKSAFEVEFKVYEGRKPLFSGCDFCVQTTMAQHCAFLFDLEKNLNATGVNVETMYTEYSDGQFEFTLHPECGIKALDDFFVLKNSIKELCDQRGYIASFMAKPDQLGCGSGAHFNFSIWDKQTDRNMMYDASQADNLSDFMKHFLAGMLKHVNAVTALCSPTVNCYRRLHGPWAPDIANWGIDNRMATYRIKNQGISGTYFENRIPSGLANPYLVMAATLAAGLDGVDQKLQCPPACQTMADPLPATLAEGLSALESDSIMIPSLGEDVMAWFIGMKREVELAKFASHSMKEEKEAEITAERNQYEKLC